MNPEQKKRYDANLIKSLEVALQKARELRYEVEEMSVTLTCSDEICTAYFALIPEPGHAVLGGDLTVRVGLKDLKVVDFQRGQ
jgi:hypothetical protein